MAEIKSTMELVLERAARMGKASSEEIEQQEAEKTGMQLAARYLDGEAESPSALIAAQEPALQVGVRKGMAETLLRNLFLPRDEHAQQRTELAARGLIDLAGGAGDIATICQELQHVIGQYRQHRDQLRDQLEEQIRMQYEQLMAQQGGGMGGTMGGELKIDPVNQPKFQEEWARLEAELDGQYNQALDQYRSQLKMRLGIS